MPNRPVARKRFTLRRSGTRARADTGPRLSEYLSVSVQLTTAMPPRLNASAFPLATPLNAFFAWNEVRGTKDRRCIVACDIARLLHGGGREICLAHLAGCGLDLRRVGGGLLVPPTAPARARRFLSEAAGSPTASAAQALLDALAAAVGAADTGRQAEVFRAFEALAKYVDLDTLARLRPRRAASRRSNVLIIKLGALGDFIQALGPIPEIRRHHAGDRMTLLTTARYAGLAAQTGLFDNILVDRRPRLFDIRGWLALRRRLRGERFARVYDFQTSDRSAAYAWLLRPGPLPEWSGTAWRCSHPHANPRRDQQHTMDRQAEQLLMAGIHPVALEPWLPEAGSVPPAVAGRRFAMLIPGSSLRHPAKRWPADRYGELAQRLSRAGCLPVVVGVAEEAGIGRAIRAACPETVDLVGCTDVAGLAALARTAAITIGSDTGATHLAAAGGNPVVVLFSGASNPSLCAPRGAAVRVLVEPDLADLAVETVFDLCLAATATTRAAPSHPR